MDVVTVKSRPNDGTSLKHLESAAREALSSVAQGPYTDAQWQRDRSTLLEYVKLLQDWRRQAEMRKCPPAPNVVPIREEMTGECPVDRAA